MDLEQSIINLSINQDDDSQLTQYQGLSLHDQVFKKNTQFTDEDIFTGCEYDGGRNVYYGDSINIQPISTTDKPYFRRLDSIPEIFEDVKNKVRERIIT